MKEWQITEIENGRVIVHCPEGDYEVVDSAVPRFQLLGIEDRWDAQSKAKRFSGPGERLCIDTRCFVISSTA